MLKFNRNRGSFKIETSADESSKDLIYLKKILDHEVFIDLFAPPIKQFNSAYLKNFNEDIRIKIKKFGTTFGETLVTCLFRSIGIDAEKRKTGVNNFRTDLILTNQQTLGICEIELGDDLLDPPRSLLDNYAVVNSRYSGNYSTVPLTIVFSLPNKRQDYWNVVSDIDKILNIKIKTISLGFLYAISKSTHPWFLQKFNEVIITSQSSNCRDILSDINLTKIPHGYNGIFEIEK